MRSNSHPIVPACLPASDWRQWAVPLCAAGAMIIVAVSGANREIFLQLNGWSRYTGDAFWANATIGGDTLVVLAFFLPFLGRRPDLIRAMVVTAVLATLWVHILKPLLDVPRPPAVLPGEMLHVIGPVIRHSAFPSGHTTSIFTLAGLLVLHLRGRYWWLIVIPAATLIGLSRAVVGVHWPLDILGGMFGGWGAALLGTWLARHWPQGLNPSFQAAVGLLLTAGTFFLLLFHDTGYGQAVWLQRLIAATALASLAASPVLRRKQRE